MPFYAYQCGSCECQFDKRVSISQRDSLQVCPECGLEEGKKVPTASGFILKGDGWAGKNNRISSQMRAKNQRLSSKQEERRRDANVRLAPNVDGQRVDSWSEASKLAKSQGKDTSGYDRRARAEKK